MLDLFIEPAKSLLRMGIDTFKTSEDMKTLTIVVQDRVQREVKFNLEVVQQIVKKDKNGELANPEDVRLALVKSLRTRAFDELNNETIPVSLFFACPLEREKWPKNPKTWGDVERYMKHTAADETLADLLERLYHRMYLAKTYADCGKLQGDMDYMRFLLMALLNSLKTVQSEVVVR